jgi:hypothetical protein
VKQVYPLFFIVTIDPGLRARPRFWPSTASRKESIS